MSQNRLLFALALCLFSACNKENPVSPTDPGTNPGPSSGYIVTVQSDRTSLDAGSNSAPATITVKAQTSDGSLPPDGTNVTISTTLGNFGTSALGESIKVVNKAMTAGQASAIFYGGSETGNANILASVGTSVGRTSIAIVTPAPLPVADFNYVINGLEVVFTDASSGATSRLWDFGDKTTSTDLHPTHVYKDADTYIVTLTAENSSGKTQKVKTVSLGATEPPKAAFSFETNGLLVHFTDMSTGSPTKWSWDFGDSEQSDLQNPSHTYKEPGTYTVKLKVTNVFGTSAEKAGFVEVSLGTPVAAFAFEQSGLTVHFTDQSTGNPTAWEWDFGDNTPTSAVQNPSHTYSTSGTYTVKLTVRNVHGASSNVSRFIEASLGVVPVADFDIEIAGLKVVFTDKSTNAPTSWAWNFGDCTNPLSNCQSDEQNPSHSFLLGGTYEVSLTATNAVGSSAPKKKLVQVSAGDPPVAKFSHTINDLTVFFLNESTGTGPLVYLWDFGCLGCATSSATNPSKTYSEPNFYTVSLTATNAQIGFSSATKIIQVGTAPAASLLVSVEGLKVFAQDTSTGHPSTWSWDFGDCSASNPNGCKRSGAGPHTYTYANPGSGNSASYTISLTVTNKLGTSTKTANIQIAGQ